MNSRFTHLKSKAITLRRQGKSIGIIESTLGIPRSTLSGWFKNVRLTNAQLQTLEKQWRDGLVKARVKAVRWHNAEKAKRLATAKNSAEEMLALIGNDVHVLELALAFLYLGEGGKSNHTSIGNSNPRILKFFIAAVQKLYGIPVSKIRCELHLRADQDPKKMIRYWSRELAIPAVNFLSVSIDKRTAGKATYPYYKGVCVVRCGQVAILRKLVYIANGFCDQITAEYARKGG